MSEMTHEDALAHFGIKGMHWGQHKNPMGSSGSSTTHKPSTQDILDARRTRTTLTKQLIDLRMSADHTTSEKGRQAIQQAIKNNNDAWASANAVAKRRTGAEKVATVMLWAGAALFAARAVSSVRGAQGHHF